MYILNKNLKKNPIFLVLQFKFLCCIISLQVVIIVLQKIEKEKGEKKYYEFNKEE